MTDVAIVDYGVGNLFSVKHACEHVGLDAVVTSDASVVRAARSVILPGVGAFGAAMAALVKLDMVGALEAVVASGRPLIGICLGLQLLFEESHEFGRSPGLGFLRGDVVRLSDAVHKVPHVGWSPVRPPEGKGWDESLLAGIAHETPMYFVHSFYVRPADPGVTLALTEHGGSPVCAAVQQDNVFACQFHPERSATEGLRVYRNLAARLASERGL